MLFHWSLQRKLGKTVRPPTPDPRATRHSPLATRHSPLTTRH
jgi:hypothetical protein